MNHKIFLSILLVICSYSWKNSWWKKLLLKIKLLKPFSKKSAIKHLHYPGKPKKLNKKFGKFLGVFQTLSKIYGGRKKAPL